MFLPLSVSTYGRQTPWANLGLIGLCAVAFFLSDFGASGRADASFALWSRDPAPHQFLTHMFLHADWMHLIGNMIFLWVFGNAVNGRLNHGLFLGFFIVAGILAGVGEMYFSGLESHLQSIGLTGERGIPMVGASGAIMGVAGMCMVLFPFNPVRVVWILFFRPFFFEMKALYLILIYAGLDLLYLLLFGHTGTAYTAHLAGFAVGVAAGFLVLKAGWVDRDGYDILAWLGRGGREQPGTAVERLHEFRRQRSIHPTTRR